MYCRTVKTWLEKLFPQNDLTLQELKDFFKIHSLDEAMNPVTTKDDPQTK